MVAEFEENTVVNLFSDWNHGVMEWINYNWWPTVAILFFVGSLISMTPLMRHHEQRFHTAVAVWLRRAMLILGIFLIALPILTAFIYDLTSLEEPGAKLGLVYEWFIALAKENWWMVPLASVAGWAGRWAHERYALPYFSKALRALRFTQTSETPSDIRKEAEKYKARDFLPAQHYRDDAVFVGLNAVNKPIYIPLATWYETNMQVVGPTRYGKGVALGCLIDQAIRRGDGVVYIDPKKDRFLPHIMYQAARDTGRKFIYLTLHDNGIGKWALFGGGSERDALSRAELAFGLELTGDPGTDFYKTQESQALESAFKKTRGIRELLNFLGDNEDARKVVAMLRKFASIESLCAKPGSGFSIEKALLENAVIYVQGDLDDSAVKLATKLFIVELIQEARRLDSQRTAHVSLFVDEVRFLVSKQLADAEATCVGFRVNIVTAYQSVKDLLSPDDKTLDGETILQCINTNSQVKLVYGCRDYETAEWASNLTGLIQKTVTRMERTDISSVGGETWERGRTVGTLEENLITTNVMLMLPPRVCLFIQPSQLAEVAFTSFIPVKDTTALPGYLSHKAEVYQKKPKQEKTAKEATANSPKTDDFSHAKNDAPEPFEEEQEPDFSHAKIAEVQPFERLESQEDR